MSDAMVGRARRLVACVLTGVTLIASVSVGAAAQTERVGVTAAVNTQATGTPPALPSRTLSIGLDMIRNERIVTGPEGKTQLLFLDGSALTIGPSAEVVLDEFVFDSASNTGKLAMTTSKGVLRVVGGKLSKADAIEVRTPTATIGIRGGIALIGPTGFAFLFGDKLTVTGTAGPSAGQTIDITRRGTFLPLGPGGAFLPLQPVTPNMLSDMLGGLEGDRGRTGGTSNPPNDQKVAAAGIDQLGSALPPEVVGTEPAAGGGDGSAPLLLLPEGQVTTQASQLQSENLLAGQQPTTTVVGSSVILTGNFAGRYKSTPGTGNAAGTAGDGTALFDRGFTDGGLSSTLFQARAGGDVFSAPVNPDGGFRAYTSSEASSPFGPISGTSFVSPNRDFVFFESIETDFVNERSFLFAGLATPASAIPTSGFGAWSIRRDFVADSNLPFIPAAVGGSLSTTVIGPALVGFNAGAGVRPFMLASVAFTPGANPGTAAVSATSILLGGAGISGPLVLDAAMRGSTRLGDGSTYFFSGPAGLAADPAGNTTFGLNGPDYFVLESLAPGGTRGISQSDPAFATDSFFPNNVASGIASTGIGASRGDVNFTGGPNGDGPVAPGFANGITQTTFGGMTSPAFVNGNIVSFSTSTATNSLSALFQVAASGNYQLAFGGSGAGPRSAFIDDQNFAAREAAAGNATGGSGYCCLIDFPFIQSYLVAGTPQMIAPLLAGTGATACACTFLRWGFWGADFISDIGSGATRERVNLGQWVAGNVPSAATVAGLGGGASYTGHAIADVMNGSAVYKAGGAFSMTYTFGTAHFGSAFITNLDGANYSGTVARGVVGYENTPAGAISGMRGATPLTGAISLRFFSGPSGPAQGVGGNFNATDGASYVVRGITVGQQ